MALKIDVAQIRDELVKAFRFGEEARVRELIPQLGSGPKQVRAELEAMLRNEDSLVRQAAAFGLGELGGAASVRRLEEQLTIEEARGSYGGDAVIEDIVRALGRIEGASARTPLVRRLERLAATPQPEPSDVIWLARALWKRRHSDMLPVVRRSLETISLPAPHGLHGLLPLLEKSPADLDAWARDPMVPIAHKIEVLVVLEEDVPDTLIPILPAFISTAEALSEPSLRQSRDETYYCEHLLRLLLADRERLLPALPANARSAARTVARRLITVTFPNPSTAAAVVLGIIGRPEDAVFLEAHCPEYPTLAKVFRDAAQALRALH
ncbi:MAG: HEAT repeat domain-containing protein [Hyalangium sp.]|uniref:HEAT repeat domain-containing protein n=1 Tax=Hyalangium sp. TaxID=2028555 RepID=UPI003899851B